MWSRDLKHFGSYLPRQTVGEARLDQSAALVKAQHLYDRLDSHDKQVPKPI